MSVYAEDDVVFFFRTRDAFGELSNMHNGFPLEFGNRVWRSSEALYQALRFPDAPAIHDAINAQTNAFLAKQKAYEFKDKTRADWHEVNVAIMEQVLRLKLDQHFEKLSAILFQTGTRPIVEKSSKDDFWGAMPDGNGVLIGENVLGTLWMVLREEVNTETFKLDVATLQL